MGEGVAYGGPPFPDTGCPEPDVCIYYVSDMINVWNAVSTFINLPWMFLPMDIFNNGLDNIQWASFISDSHTKLSTISRRLPRFAIGSTFGVSGRGWTTFDSVFLTWHLVCNFGIVERIFYRFLVLVCLYITQVLLVIFSLYIFTLK